MAKEKAFMHFSNYDLWDRAAALFQPGIPGKRFRSLTTCAQGSAVSHCISMVGWNRVGSSNVPTR